MFRIGHFSKLVFVSIRMLRYYDEVGIFKPNLIDAETGYRYYSAMQIKRLNQIILLRDMGFTVNEIAMAMSNPSDDGFRSMLENRKNQVEEDIENDKAKLKKINFAIENIGKERIDMDYNVIIKEIPSYKVISYRGRVSNYYAEGELWEKLGRFVGKNNIKTDQMCYAIYHDEGHKEKDVDIEVVMQVNKLGTDEGDFIYKETEKVDKAASILIVGPYSKIAPTFNYLAKWIEENGYSMVGNARQIPIKGPWMEKDEKKFVTEICIPIK